MALEQLEPTPSVAGAMKDLGHDKPASATQFADAILDQADHRLAYAGGQFTTLKLEETDERILPREWLDGIQTLFDPTRVRERGHDLRLHGKLAIIGLALLDSQLYRQLDRAGAFQAMVKELDPPLDDLADILSDAGRDQKASLDRESFTPADTVPNWPDDPLTDPDQDLLGRAAFARFLAKRLVAIPRGSGAYAMQLYGAWGAGKSSMLNFLRIALEHLGVESEEKWLVVQFNAWQNQHIDPPWWSLMDAVFRRVKGELGWWNRLQEHWWRLFSGRLSTILAVVVLAWLLVLAIGWTQQAITDPLAQEGKPIYTILNTIATAAEDLGKILALVGTIWGGMLAINRSLLLGSAAAAQRYKDRVHDPTNEIKKRFNTLISRLGSCRVAVLIDDLDRCQPKYVIDLLEGIQTLFREAPVVYVIAADRRWLNACYEQVYEKLEPLIREPFKSLGTLFLEKAFRFATPMPGIPDELKSQYWRYLLMVAPEDRGLDWTQARTWAGEQAAGVQDEQSLQELARPDVGRSFVEQQAMREEVVLHLANPEVIRRLEHTLRPYARLLDPNPRAMKRLVNAYSARRALAILSGAGIDRHQLVLWLILSARWPELAEHLERSPQDVDEIDPGSASSSPDIFRDPEVHRVVCGDTIGPRLSRETIEQCACMHG
jgi:hypothetical protein